MAPPKYGDLGKQANDVFSKGYHFGLLKLEVKTKTNTGVEFTTGGNSNLETGKVAGNLETKYQVKDLGMTLTEKWTTDNSLNTTVDVVDKVNRNIILAEKMRRGIFNFFPFQLVPGLKVSLDTKFAPGTGRNRVGREVES